MMAAWREVPVKGIEGTGGSSEEQIGIAAAAREWMQQGQNKAEEGRKQRYPGIGTKVDDR